MPKKKEETKKELSKEAIAYKAFLDAYKAQNPAKYEAKKEALEAKLKSL